MKEQTDLYVTIVILFIGALCYVSYVNSKDSELIENCRHDVACVNPYTGKGLP